MISKNSDFCTKKKNDNFFVLFNFWEWFFYSFIVWHDISWTLMNSKLIDPASSVIHLFLLSFYTKIILTFKITKVRIVLLSFSFYGCKMSSDLFKEFSTSILVVLDLKNLFSWSTFFFIQKFMRKVSPTLARFVE